MKTQEVINVLQKYTESLEKEYNDLKGQLRMEFKHDLYRRMTETARTISVVTGTIRELGGREVTA